MNSILNRASRNFLWQHPWQLVLAIVGIALGVAVVIAIDLAMESSLKSFNQAGKAYSGTATHRIVASDGGLDEKLYTRLRVEQGIAHLSPVVTGYVQLAQPDGGSFKLIGIDPFIEKPLHSGWQNGQSDNSSPDFLTRLITESNSVLLSEKTAQRLHLKINDQLTVVTDRGQQQLKIIGLLTFNSAVSEQVLAKLIITDIATAQEVLGLFGRLSSIEVLIEKQAPETLAAIQKALPGTVLLVSIDSQA
jgi:putative ABC transport system permease protein